MEPFNVSFVNQFAEDLYAMGYSCNHRLVVNTLHAEYPVVSYACIRRLVTMLLSDDRRSNTRHLNDVLRTSFISNQSPFSEPNLLRVDYDF